MRKVTINVRCETMTDPVATLISHAMMYGYDLNATNDSGGWVIKATGFFEEDETSTNPFDSGEEADDNQSPTPFG